jgi:hypothetical protein
MYGFDFFCAKTYYNSLSTNNKSFLETYKFQEIQPVELTYYFYEIFNKTVIFSAQIIKGLLLEHTLS